MKRLKGVYQSTAFITFNTLLFLVILNLGLGLFYFIKDRPAPSRAASPPSSPAAKLFNDDGSPIDNGERTPFQLQWFDYNATKEVSQTEVGETLDDFTHLTNKGFIYQPWVQFSEPVFAGRRVSVDKDERGFPIRRTINPSATGNAVIEIFALGGSTTFGYNVADDKTWPSYLSTVLNEKAKNENLGVQIKVTNYGRGFYYPSQEEALLVDLFRSGHRPELVLFMDGVNTGGVEDSPYFTEELGQAFRDMQQPNQKLASEQSSATLQKWIPMARLANSIKMRWQKVQPSATPQPVNPNGRSMGGQFVVAQILNRFEQNRRISASACELYGAKALFFIQPDAFYNYPAELYRQPPPPAWWTRRTQLQPFYEGLARDSEFINLSNLFQRYGVNPQRKAILDDVHYTPGFNRFLAEQIAAHIDLRSLKASRSFDESAATGAARR